MIEYYYLQWRTRDRKWIWNSSWEKAKEEEDLSHCNNYTESASKSARPSFDLPFVLMWHALSKSKFFIAMVKPETLIYEDSKDDDKDDSDYVIIPHSTTKKK